MREKWEEETIKNVVEDTTDDKEDIQKEILERC